MIVPFNSDIMYAQRPLKGKLPTHLDTLLRAFAHNGVAVMIPETTVYEFEHAQDQRAIESRNELEGAYRLLEGLGSTFERVDPDDAIKTDNLMTLIRHTGVEASVPLSHIYLNFYIRIIVAG